MEIITREAWGAVAPTSVTKVARAKRRRFDVHYSAGPTSQTPRDIQRFHMETRDWADVGYNFLVRAGKIYEGRGWDVLGAHIGGHNTDGIGVCFIGRDGDATDADRRAIRWLADEADRIMGRKLTRDGHRDLAATECPGDKLHAWVHGGMPVDGPAAPGRPAPVAQLDVDGRLGPRTITRWQQVMGTPVDGKISDVSMLTKAVQRRLNAKLTGPDLDVDGRGIRQDGRTYKTARALQRYLGTEQDGILSVPVSAAVKALQRRLNGGTF